ncbi:MAG: N-acetyltransferase [Tissierellia bacterium]|nr:N-acetyltransferase [Tissierellia bacterium]
MFEYEFLEDQNMFIAKSDGVKIGEVTFVNSGENVMIIDHTGVESEWSGNNIGFELVSRVVDLAKQRNKKIIPLCPFARREFTRTPEFQEIEYK